MRRLIGLTGILVLAVAITGCGDDCPTAPPAAAPAPQALGIFEFDSGAGSRTVADSVIVSMQIGSDGSKAAADLFRLRLTNGDGSEPISVGAAGNPEFAAAVALLVNGENDDVSFGRAFPSGGGGTTISTEETFFDGGILGNYTPDFAGAEVTGAMVVFEELTVVSPGSDPNGDGIWTEVTLRGKVVIMGHP